MRAGLVGYAQSGKTTLFSALTGLHAATRGQVNPGGHQGPGPTHRRALGHLQAEEDHLRRDALRRRPRPQGQGLGPGHRLPAGPGRGGGLLPGGARLPPRWTGPPADPARELADFDAELVLHDLGIVEKRLERMRREHGKGTAEYLHMEQLHAHLDPGTPPPRHEVERGRGQGPGPLRLPLPPPAAGGVVNVAEEAAAAPTPPEVEAAARQRTADVLPLCAAVEAEIAQLDPGEQPDFLASLGLTEPARARFIRAAYRLLDLVSFFTVGRGRGPRLAHPPRRPGPARRRPHPLRPGARVHPGGGGALPGLHRPRERGPGPPGGEAPPGRQGVPGAGRRHPQHPVRGLAGRQPAGSRSPPGER